MPVLGMAERTANNGTYVQSGGTERALLVEIWQGNGSQATHFWRTSTPGAGFTRCVPFTRKLREAHSESVGQQERLGVSRRPVRSRREPMLVKDARALLRAVGIKTLTVEL